ncbi:MAG: mucoidy inhibitor MuiA family protein [Pseudomonadota bacterium]
MRHFLLTLSIAICAGPIWADEFQVETTVSRVTIFPQGALITRQAFVDIPGGTHQIVFREPVESSERLPNVILPDSAGLRLISLEVADLNGVPASTQTSALYQARLAAFEAAQQALAQFELGDIALEADMAAARTVLRAVESLAGPNGQLVGSEGELNPDATLDLVTKMSVQAFEAQAKLNRAEAGLAGRDIAREALIRELEIAQAALEATPNDVTEFATFVLTVEASRRVAGALRLEGFTREAEWTPTYRLDLDYEGMEGTLAVARQALIQQNSGLNWNAARVTLSTANPFDPTQVETPRERILRLTEELPKFAPSASRDFAGATAEIGALSEPVVESIEVSNVQGAGEPVEFTLSDAVTLASGYNSGVLVEIDGFEAPVNLFAEAVAARDMTATLATEFTYDRGGVLLAGESTIFHNGAYIGEGRIPEIANGDDAKIGLGALKSLLVQHRTISQSEGDRGIISSSNSREVRTETEIVNLSSFDVPLRLYDVLPVSESDDLRVTEVSQPRPDERNIEGRRGVVQWTLDLKEGETQIIRFGYDFAWPRDFVVVPN